MWLKRWSVKAPSNADDDTIKSQAPLAEHKETSNPVVPQPSVKPGSVVEDEPGNGTGKQEVGASSADPSSVPRAEGKSKDPVSKDIPTGNPDHSLPADSLPTQAPDSVPEDIVARPPPNDGASATAPIEGEANGIDSHAVRKAVDVPTPANMLSAPEPQLSPTRARRLSFRSLAFFYGRDKDSTADSPPLKARPAEPLKSKPISPKPKLSRTEKRALSSAVALRTLIIGPDNLSIKHSAEGMKAKQPAKLTGALSLPNLKKLKSQLMKPSYANAVIAQLRRLPLPDGPSFHPSARASAESLVTHPDAGGAPIHAVCLACTDEEADQKHFSGLRASHNHASTSLSPPGALPIAPDPSSQGHSSVATASLESLIPVLQNLHIISLLASPDLGFGQPVNEQSDTGPLVGAVPSAGAIAVGFEEVTKQLMSLGFATSKAVFPSHAGIYPPEDRMSVLTYWWGLELVLPEPSVQYLSKVKSISNTLLNFLSALALFNNGVREVLPFIRYVANFVGFEWDAIKGQDRGQGVVCAATWIMPAAMVPRPWDFPSRPASTPKKTSAQDKMDSDASGGDSGGEAPARLPPQESYPATPPNVLYPPAPAMPMLPQLMLTPATLPRSTNPPQGETIT